MNLRVVASVVFGLSLLACESSGRSTAPSASASNGGSPASSGSSIGAVSPALPMVLSSRPALPADLASTYGIADVVVVGKLRGPKIDAILEVDPPRYVHAFEVVIEERIGGGATPAVIPAKLSSLTQTKPFAADTRVVVALERIEGTLPAPSVRYEAIRVDPATPALEKTLAASLLRAPDALTLAIAQAPGAPGSPSDTGDGVFTVTLRNDGDVAVVVPGVFAHGDASAPQVDWAHALTIRDEPGRALRLPDVAVPDGTIPLRLAPHAKVETTIDVKRFGIVRKTGGEQQGYAFRVGALQTSSWFYYVHAYHGPRSAPVVP